MEPFVLSELKKVVFFRNEGQDISLEIKVFNESVTHPVLIEEVVFCEVIDDSKTIMNIMVTPNDFNWYKKPKKPELVNFLQENYDLVIDLTEKEEEYHKFILQFVNTKVVAGFKGLKEYTVNLNVKNNNLLFIEELLRYLSTFKK